MVLATLVLILVFSVTAALYGGMLLLIGRDASPASERLPWRSWTGRDLWHYVSLGARENVRVKSLGIERWGRAGR
jgi:hypothetical protein